jgi:hypothetical protein
VSTMPIRRVFPLSSDASIPRGEVLELEVDSVVLGGTDAHFKPERLVVSRGAEWTIRSIEFDGREQIDQELPGALFAADGAFLHARWLDSLKTGSKIRLVAAHSGGQGDGEFRAALVGVDVPPTSDPRALSGPVRLRDGATGVPIAAACDGPDRVLPGQSAWFVARPQITGALLVEGIIIDLACEEWTIEDLRVGGRGQFAAAGSVPGEVFAPGVVDAILRLDLVAAGGELAIKAAYRGTNPRGRFFGATCVCREAR